MKKACKYCGKIHDTKYICEKKPHEKYHRNYKRYSDRQEDIFRSSYDWKQKRESIKRRDRYLCQACRNNLAGTVRRLNTEDLSVHHIIPIHADYDRRLDDSNLITLCRFHHELAESGEIPAEILAELLPPME